MQPIIIPHFLMHLPKDDRGYPIPYFVAIVDGKPDFRMLDIVKQTDCFKRHLCGVCGKVLDKTTFYTISGPMGLKNGVTHEPFMHRDCGAFSLASCPHLHLQKAQRRETDDHRTMTPANMKLEKPDTLYLIRCSKKFDPFVISGVLQYHYKTVGYFTYTYVNGKLKTDAKFKRLSFF